MNRKPLRTPDETDDGESSTNQFTSTLSLNTTASLTSTVTSAKPSKFYGNITIEMIDDFLNPNTRLKMSDAESEKKSQRKQFTSSTTKGMGLFELSSDDEQPDYISEKNRFMREHKKKHEFDYVREHKKAFESELSKSLKYVNRGGASTTHTSEAMSDINDDAQSSFVGSGMSQIESVTTLNMAPSVQARIARRADKIPIRRNQDTLDEVEGGELNEEVMQQINMDLNNNANKYISTPSEYEEALTNEIYKHYVPRDNYDPRLPITSKRDRIMDVIQANKFCIIQGGTGCGKSTQVPQYILDWHAQKKRRCNIIVTQPRRIAAMSVARRVCVEHNWTLGGTCGYQIGLDSKNVSIDTRITYCTTGVLLQKLIGPHADNNFNKYTHIILDEVHERDLDTDFLLLMIKLRSLKRLNSKIILMSATIETERFADYYKPDGFHSAPILSIPCSTFQVQDFYWEDLAADKSSFIPANSRYFYDLLARISMNSQSYTSTSLVKRSGGEQSDHFDASFGKRLAQLEFNYEEPSLMSETIAMVVLLLKYFDDREMNDSRCKAIDGLVENRGSVLIFAPGMHEIQTLHEIITKEMKDKKINLLPLHSDIVIEQQVQVFDKSKPFWRKVIISTSIAESSITVPDIKYVIDFCLTKELYCDPFTNYTHLRLEWASQSSANQRRGRAGRVSDGMCYRLVTRRFYDKLKQYADPAMLREPLPRVILNTKRLKPKENPKKILALAIQPPKASDIERTILMLKEAGALTLRSSRDDDEQSTEDFLYDGDLTFAGTVMANLPLDIRLSKLILLGFAFGKLRETIIIAAALSTKTFFTCYFKSHLESFKAKWMWSQGWMCDCICILNAFNLWESLNARDYFQSKRQQYEWTKNNMVQLERLREVEMLKKEIEDRLRFINIHCEEYHHDKSDLIDNNCFNESEQTIKSNLILKLLIAGAFYPNYFNAHKVNLEEVPKMLSGKDPRNTVLVKNLPLNNGILYHQKLSDIFRFCSKQQRIHFEDSKALIEFKSKCEEVSSNINLGVYLAVQMRMLRLPMIIPKYNEEVSFQKMKKFNRERQLNSNLSVSFDKNLDGLLTLKVEESDCDEEDDGGESDLVVASINNENNSESNYDSEEEHHRFVTGQKSLSRISLSSSSHDQTFNTLARLNKTRPNLIINRLTACNDTITEHLSNPKYHFASSIETYKNKLIDICVTEIVECAHFWCQIKDQAHIDTLLLIQNTLNPANTTLNASQLSLTSTMSASGQLKTVDPKNLYPDALCVTHFTDTDSNETNYYRVRILYVNREKYCCDVHFVDYGNKASRSFNELFELDPDLKKYPFQAIECKLANIKLSILYNPNGVWTQISNKKFHSFLHDTNYSSFRIKLIALNNDHALVDLFGVKLNFKEIEQSLVSISELLIDSHCADRYIVEDQNASSMSSTENLRDILYIPTRQSEYSSARPTATSQNPTFKNKYKSLLTARAKEDLRSIDEKAREDEDEDEDSLRGSDMDENDESLYAGKISLNGPYSPLEVKYYSLLNVGQCKKTRVERDSINYVCLDDDPYNDTNRLLVSTAVSINPSGNCMILRKTTLMPKLKGLTALCCMLFTPKMEIRMSPDQSAYTGCVCGLGFDPLSKTSIYPDNDMELEFDVKVDVTDFQTINAVRVAINMMIGSKERVDGWHDADSKLKELQAIARDKLLKVIDRERETIEPESFRKQNKWNQLPKVYEKIKYNDQQTDSDSIFYSSHDIPVLVPKKNN